METHISHISSSHERVSAMKSAGPSGTPHFTPAQALCLAHPARPGSCALIGTYVPFYGAGY